MIARAEPSGSRSHIGLDFTLVQYDTKKMESGDFYRRHGPIRGQMPAPASPRTGSVNPCSIILAGSAGFRVRT